MCDQLSSVGLEFHADRVIHLSTDSLCWSAAHSYPYTPHHLFEHFIKTWAHDHIMPLAVRVLGAKRDTEENDIEIPASRISPSCGRSPAPGALVSCELLSASCRSCWASLTVARVCSFAWTRSRAGHDRAATQHWREHSQQRPCPSGVRRTGHG